MIKHANKSRFDQVGRFKRPMDVVEATCIPVSEKLSILKAWEGDERALQRAEDEAMGRSAVNMPSASRPGGARPAAKLAARLLDSGRRTRPGPQA